MITLTTPIHVPSELGGSTFNSYDKLRVVSIISDPVSMTINAQVQMMVSSNASLPMIQGTLTIVATGASPVVTLQVLSMNFFTGVPLGGGSLTTVQGWITGLQNSIESGLISTAIVAGTQSAGV